MEAPSSKETEEQRGRRGRVKKGEKIPKADSYPVCIGLAYPLPCPWPLTVVFLITEEVNVIFLSYQRFLLFLGV